MKEIEAIVIHNSRKKSEVRCGKCGKLLFICKNLSFFSEKQLTNRHKGLIIVSRCPRNDCKADNLLVLNDPS